MAYPSASKDGAKLVGKIIIRRNSVAYIKQQKFVLVKVDTNIQGTDADGFFATVEKDYLRKCMYQGLIYPILEDASHNLDLRSNLDYKIDGTSYGKFIFENTTNSNDYYDGGLYEDYNHPSKEFFIDLQTLFLDETNNAKYKSYYTAFSLDEIPYDITTFGQNQKIKVKNLALFSPSGGRKTTTFAHESLHGLGLYHTHKDSHSITESPIKFTFTKYTTGNIESYSSVRLYTWRWQWDIIRKNV